MVLRPTITYLITLMVVVCVTSLVSPRLVTAQNSTKDKDLPHFLRIDENYFRGAQPTVAGFRKLAEMGIQLVIDLRETTGERDEEEEKLVTSLGMRYVNLSISTVHAPEETRVQQFIGLLKESKNTPVFVHCWRGNDRTGLMTGIYRVEFYHWTADAAYQEMKDLGFSFSFLRRGMKSYLFKYAERKLAN